MLVGISQHFYSQLHKIYFFLNIYSFSRFNIYLFLFVNLKFFHVTKFNKTAASIISQIFHIYKNKKNVKLNFFSKVFNA